jgi:hypothetical protein
LCKTNEKKIVERDKKIKPGKDSQALIDEYKLYL